MTIPIVLSTGRLRRDMKKSHAALKAFCKAVAASTRKNRGLR